MPDTINTSTTQTARVLNECSTNDTSATRVRQKQHECNTSVTQVRHECYTNDMSATRLRNFDFDNDTSENIFFHACIIYMANERLHGQQQFHSKNYLLEMSCSHAKIHLKSAPQKLNFAMTKAISESYTLDYSCKCSSTFPHSNA